MIFSVILFFASQIHLISAETQTESKTYSYVQPLGPKVLNGIGSIIPFFKNMFSDMQHFFQKVSDKAK
jgi:membrane protein required for colicin V production